VFTRKTLAGEFIVVNRALVRTLEERGCGTSGQGGYHHERGVRPGLDEDLVPRTWALFKTSMGPQAEGSLDHAATVPYVCQSQSTAFHVSADTRQGAGGFVLWL
jgi:hypothetical protein